jgi:UDP-N-acetylmuramate: L-alanyl-gamma-D-glutamyl-meso-diaminopimelate ligase
VTVIEDFAHHPTAVRLTLASIRERFPDRRLLAVFEPRSATSRRKVFQKEYVEAFLGADRTFLAAPYDQSKIPETERFSTEELASDIRDKNRPAESAPTVAKLLEALLREAQRGDVIVLMSNGGFENIYEKLLKGLGGK